MQAKAQECFLEHQPYINRLARRFQLQHGGELDELKGEAQLLFVVAYNSHNPDISTWRNQSTGAKKAGTLKSWVTFNIWKGLTETARKIARRHNNLPREYIDLNERHDRNHFDYDEFVAGLSPDAARIVMLAVDQPIDIVMIAGTRRGGMKDRRGDPHAKNIAAAICEFLEELGWNGRRIAKAFNEVREALA